MCQSKAMLHKSKQNKPSCCYICLEISFCCHISVTLNQQSITVKAANSMFLHKINALIAAVFIL